MAAKKSLGFENDMAVIIMVDDITMISLQGGDHF